MERLTQWIDDGERIYAVPHMELKNNGHQKCCDKLASYEDAEEQGLLIRLPCKYVYYLVDVNSKWGGMVMKKSIKDLSLYEIEQIDKRKHYSTREEAEAALERMW